MTEGMTVDTAIYTVAFVAMIVTVLVLTRKRPGRRYQKKEPGRAEADKDSWGWPG